MIQIPKLGHPSSHHSSNGVAIKTEVSTGTTSESPPQIPPFPVSQALPLTTWHPPSETELADKLVKEGPHKQEPTNRRVRALLGGKWIFDTLEATYVWEHPYCRRCCE